jgi:hypothetical protein
LNAERTGVKGRKGGRKEGGSMAQTEEKRECGGDGGQRRRKVKK